jgi:hypothetical protein
MWRPLQWLRGAQETGGIYVALYKLPFRGLSSGEWCTTMW